MTNFVVARRAMFQGLKLSVLLSVWKKSENGLWTGMAGLQRE